MSSRDSYWSSSHALKKYANPRSWEQRFRSEVYFLEQIVRPEMSVLDVGCAAGDLFAALNDADLDSDYTGVDYSEPLIDLGRKTFPKATFVLGDFLDSIELPRKTFDLVTATGVFQHEPRFDQLLDKLLEVTAPGGYLLFDLKLFSSHETICDREVAYCDHDPPMHYIVYNHADFLQRLGKRGAFNVELFGYYSGMHSSVRIPEEVTEQVCSAHVLISKPDAASSSEVVRFAQTLPSPFHPCTQSK